MRGGVEMRVLVSRFALVALVAVATVADAGSPWNHVETVWETKAEIGFRLGPLLDQDLMPVLNHVPDPARTGPGAPELSLLDLADGKAKWTIPTGSDVNCMAAAGDLIVLTTSGSGPTNEGAIVGAVRVADGKVIWRVPLEDRLDDGTDQSAKGRQMDGFADWDWARTQGIGGGVAVVGDRVFLKVGQRVFCLARESGNVLWGTDVGFYLSVPLTPCGKLLLAATSGHGLHALDQQTGKIAWTTPMDSIMRIYALGDPIYIETHGYSFGRLDPATGAPMWQVPTTAGPRSVRPVGERIVLRNIDCVRILDAATGAEELKAPTSGYGSTLSDDTLYYCLPTAAGAHPTELVAVGIADHREKWRMPLGQAAIPHYIAGNLLVQWTDYDVGGLRPADGSLLWEWHCPFVGGGIDPLSLAGEGNRIYFHTMDRAVGFDSETGTCVLDAPGAFYQRSETGAFGPRPMPWMRLRGDNLWMRDMTSPTESFTCLRLTRVEGEAAGN